MEGFIISVVLTLVFIVGMVTGGVSIDNYYRRELLERNLGHYNTKTAAFELIENCGGK